MKESNAHAGPRLLLAACIPSHAKTFGEWRSHTFDQFCLIADGDVGLELGSRKFEIGAPTLLFIRGGEKHGYWRMAGQSPNFWVLAFRDGRPIYENLPALNQRDAGRRMWRLSANQSAAFREFFIRLICERAAHPEKASPAESAWLRLLMVAVQRWVEPKPWAGVEAPGSQAELLQTPARINGHARKLEQVDLEVPTYDSLRHLFRKTFGGNPKI
jgi:hypothetical protein